MALVWTGPDREDASTPYWLPYVLLVSLVGAALVVGWTALRLIDLAIWTWATVTR